MEPGKFEWIPTYPAGKAIVEIPLDCGECPVSVLLRNPEAVRLAESVSRARVAAQTGQTPWAGAALTDWPARMADAWIVIQREENRVQNLIAEREMEDLQRNG